MSQKDKTAAAPAPQPVQGEAVRWIVRGARCDDDFRGEDAARRYAKAVGGTVIPLYPQPPVERLVGHDHAGLYEELREAIDNGHESMSHLDALAWVEDSHAMREIKPTTQPPAPAVGDDPGRYFASGPDRHFYTDDPKFAEMLIAGLGDADEWTLTELPTPAVQIAAPGDVEREIRKARTLIDHFVHGEVGADALTEAHDSLTAALRSQGQADAVGEAEAFRAVLKRYQDGRVFSNPHTRQVARAIAQEAEAALAQQANKEQP